MAAAVQIISSVAAAKPVASPVQPVQETPAQAGGFDQAFDALAPGQVAEADPAAKAGEAEDRPSAEAEARPEDTALLPDPQMQVAAVVLPLWKLSLAQPQAAATADPAAPVLSAVDVALPPMAPPVLTAPHAAPPNPTTRPDLGAVPPIQTAPAAANAPAPSRLAAAACRRR